MDDIDEAGVAGVETDGGGHSLEVGLGGVQARDAAEPCYPLARVARRVSAQAVANHVHLRGIQPKVLLETTTTLLIFVSFP